VNNNQLLRTYDTEDSFSSTARLAALIELFLSRLCVYKQNATFSIRANRRENLTPAFPRKRQEQQEAPHAINHGAGSLLRSVIGGSGILLEKSASSSRRTAIMTFVKSDRYGE
jgi:hypothetical protein